MTLSSQLARRLPAPVLSTVVHRDLHRSPEHRRDERPLALVHGNCQAEALRRILAAHPGFAAGFQLLRVPAVHEITPRELRRIERWLPHVELLITQPVRSGYRGLALGSEELVARLPHSARVLRYPVAYFEGLYPFQVYVHRRGDDLATGVPLTDYHDLRHLYAASRGWDVDTTLSRLEQLRLDPDWVRENAERSLAELARREQGATARIAGLVGAHLTTSFFTVNHPVNGVVVEVARQLLEALGLPDADYALDLRQGYLDHTRAPREPQVVTALGGEPTIDDARWAWTTPSGVAGRREVVTAHLAAYAADPGLLADGLAKHAGRLEALGAMWEVPSLVG